MEKFLNTMMAISVNYRMITTFMEFAKKNKITASQVQFTLAKQGTEERRINVVVQTFYK